jgi:hypothetical protein
VYRATLLILAALLVALLAASPALAEGHHCRHWYPDPYYGGYWLWLDCGPNDLQAPRWSPSGWYSDLPAYEWNSEYLDIRQPLYY